MRLSRLALAMVAAQTIAMFTGPPWLRVGLLGVQLLIVGYSIGMWRSAKQRLADLQHFQHRAQEMDAIMFKLVALMREAGWEIPSWPGEHLSDDQKAGLN